MMDDLVKDNPEMAFELLKLMGEKQRRTGQDLEETRQDNAALRARVAQLEQALRGAGGEQAEGSQSDELMRLRNELEQEREANKRLLGDNADLKFLVSGNSRDVDEDGPHIKSRSTSQGMWTECSPGCKSRFELHRTQSELEQQTQACEDMRERVVELEQDLQRCEEARDARAQRVAELEGEAQTMKLEYVALECRAEDCERDLKNATSALNAQRAQFEGVQQQWREERLGLEKAHFDLQKDFDLCVRKYRHYKALALANPNATQADTSPVIPNVPLPTLPAPGVSLPPAPPAPLPTPVPSVPLPTPPTHNAPLPTPPPTATPEAQSPLVPHAAVPAAPAQPTTHRQTTDEDAHWRALLDHALARPCFPPHEPGAPLALPRDVKKHITTWVLSCPHRIVFPPATPGRALLLAPVARVRPEALPGAAEARAGTHPDPRAHVGALPNSPPDTHGQLGASGEPDARGQIEGWQDPAILGPRMTELHKHAGARREVFAHTARGVCYVGTFACGAVEAFGAAGYGALGDETQEALLRHTFPSRAAYVAAPRAARAAVRAAHAGGALPLQALPLVYEGRNEQFADALEVLREERVRAGRWETRRARSRSRSPYPSHGRSRSRSPRPAYRGRTRSPPRTPYPPGRSRSPYTADRGRSRVRNSPPPWPVDRGRTRSPARRPQTPPPHDRARTPPREERTRDPRPRPPRAPVPADRPADPRTADPRSRAASPRARSRGPSRVPSPWRGDLYKDGRMEGRWEGRSEELSATPMRGGAKRPAEGGCEGGRAKWVKRE